MASVLFALDDFVEEKKFQSTWWRLKKCVKCKFPGELSRCAGVYHVGLHPLAVLGTPLVDVLSGRIGAHEADGLDGWMVADEVHRYTKHTNITFFLHPISKRSSSFLKVTLFGIVNYSTI